MKIYHLHLYGNHWALSLHGNDTPHRLFRDLPKTQAFELSWEFLKGSDSCLKVHDRDGLETSVHHFSPEDKEKAKA